MNKLKYIIDLDGTIYNQNQLIPHADEFINYLIRIGRDFVIFTNSPEKSPWELSQKLKTMRVHVNPDRIVTAGCITREYLLEQSTRHPVSAFVVGTRQLKDSFSQSGIEVIEGKSPIADFVVIGFEREFCYETLRLACLHVFNGAGLIATNADESIPTENGPIPHTGSLMAAVEYATGVKALVLGKPETNTFSFLQKKLHCKRSELCIVGDRLDTDMKFGRLNRFKSFLVLTGMTKQDDLNLHSDLLFDQSFNSLLDVMNYDMQMNAESR
ncbi:MAG TPA: HAD-IIA family hydrolase [Clostridium sp.]